MKRMFPDKDWISHALTHNVERVVGEEDLGHRLLTGRPLRIKFGVDVTHPLIHLGHGVSLWKMREFQEHGHKVLFLIGDFTTRIGDPTGKSKTRPERTEAEIERDARLYIEQVTKILIDDSSVFEVRRNSEWYGMMPLSEFLGLCRKITHARLIERDMFQKRMGEGSEIYMHELLYPILQGYDSVVLKSDLTIIGSDQLFNEMMGRHYQTLFGQSPQAIMTTVITPGLDGKEKQSKSLGNFIAISDTPSDMYGKTMTLPDELIVTYFRVYTFASMEEIDAYETELNNGANPRDVKMKLAHALVSLYHGTEAADNAQENFVNTFQKKQVGEDVGEVTVKLPLSITEFLKESGHVKSNSEARRLVDERGVRMEGETITDPQHMLEEGDNGKIIKVGKRYFYKIVTQ
ncbi:MAG: tyrosine--tRNA ligase [Patescibacteria group bacterium]|nr:tyrosine--tRNA ligase [Patescibacteria group bacterium]MDE2438482.1 tyrosine--tRNA ligase [Patescibacteria group bacterium]